VFRVTDKKLQIVLNPVMGVTEIIAQPTEGAEDVEPAGLTLTLFGAEKVEQERHDECGDLIQIGRPIIHQINLQHRTNQSIAD
jgi:hypothetical protein